MTAFEHSGFWWDPREPETKWPATLSFDPVNGAVLTRRIAEMPRSWGSADQWDTTESHRGPNARRFARRWPA